MFCAPTLTYFDAELPVTLTCDASQYGLGATCLQDDGKSPRPVAYASCTMTDTEQRYTQIEKELFAVSFGGVGSNPTSDTMFVNDRQQYSERSIFIP